MTNWSLNEPLCRSQSLPYLVSLATRGFRSCLMTFERAPYAMARGDAAAAKRRLAALGICWHPVRYHQRSRLSGAVLDGLKGVGVACAALARHRARIVHTRASVAAPIGFIAATLLSRRFLYDADSELSQEYVDGGHWAADGLRYRCLSLLERLCRRHADGIVVLTDKLRTEFLRTGVRTPIAVIPCCVDVQRFAFDEGARTKRRAEIGVSSHKLLVYVGKLGPRYMVGETMAFVRTVRRRLPDVRLLVVTHDDLEPFQKLAREAGIGDIVTAVKAAPEEVPEWLAAADAGLALIRPAPSERGSSPIKISEYLAAGLPVVTTPSIGDISDVVESSRLGIVVSSMSQEDVDVAAGRLLDLWSGPSDQRRSRAAWAEANLSLQKVGEPRYSGLYEGLLSGVQPLVVASESRQ